MFTDISPREQLQDGTGRELSPAAKSPCQVLATDKVFPIRAGTQQDCD